MERVHAEGGLSRVLEAHKWHAHLVAIGDADGLDLTVTQLHGEGPVGGGSIFIFDRKHRLLLKVGIRPWRAWWPFLDFSLVDELPVKA